MYKYINILFLAIFALVAVLIGQGTLSLISVLWVFFGWLLITFIGATNIRMNYFLKAFSKQNLTDEKVIALTFDDGPSENTLKILKILREYNATATFFCIGHKIDEHPEIFKQILNEGHCVGNHTYAHSPITGFFSANRVEREIQACDDAAKSAGGVAMNLFRPPSGVTNPKIKKALSRTGHHLIGWSIRTFDAMLRSEKTIFKIAVRDLNPGDVILFHDTKPHTSAILEQLLLVLQERNFKTVPVDTLFKIDAYR